MNDAERRQLVSDLMVLSDTLCSAMQTAQGEQLKQLLELANESQAALQELTHASQSTASGAIRPEAAMQH